MNKRKRYEILNSLPASGPMYVPISENGKEFYSEGFVIKFFKDNGTEWVANFATGWGIKKVIEYSGKNLIVVFASGIGYVMNPNNEKPLKIIGAMNKDIFQADSGEIFCINDIGIKIFDPETLEIWTSKRISWDGFNELTFDNGIIKGKSNSLGEWVDFSFDTESKEIKGGSFKY